MKNIWLYLKILSFILIIVFVSCSNNLSPVSVVGQDEEFPDTTIFDGRYNMDIDSDGVTDFAFKYELIASNDVPSSVMSKMLKVYPGDNLILYTTNFGFLPLNNSDTISSKIYFNQRWSHYSGTLASHSWEINQGWGEYWMGAWAGASNKYLPFGLQLTDSIYYGWIELSVDKLTGAMTIHDYSVNDNENELILAGIKE